MKLVAFQVHTLHMRVADFESCRVFAPMSPVGYLRRSSLQVTFNPLAVVVPAIRLTIVS